MLELEGKMAFSFIIGFMDGAIPTMYLKQIESELQNLPFEVVHTRLPEVESPQTVSKHNGRESNFIYFGCN